MNIARQIISMPAVAFRSTRITFVVHARRIFGSFIFLGAPFSSKVSFWAIILHSRHTFCVRCSLLWTSPSGTPNNQCRSPANE
jgi:hypothetical protein